MAESEDRERFLTLLAEHESQLMGFLCAISPNYQDAEDLMQQTVLTMWRKFSQFQSGSSFVAWGCQIGRYKAMNMLTSRRLAPLDDDIIESLLVTVERQEPEIRHARRRALSGCLQRLAKEDRELIEAAYTENRPIKQLAQEIGRSAGGVYNSLSRIRSCLFRCVQATLSQEGYQ